MPEGDTIRKLRNRLRPRIVHQTLQRLAFKGRRSAPIPARPVVSEVDCHGKHLLIELDGRLILRAHLGLHGSLRTLPHHAPLPAPPQLSLLIDTGAERFVGRRMRSVELFGRGLLAQHPILSRLGPDLLVEPVPLETILARLHRLAGEREASDVLLDQHVAAGIGNVYQNELLFRSGVHPQTPARSVGDATWIDIYAEAARQLRFNLDTRLRKTTFDAEGAPLRGVPRHWVYGRAGEACLRCRRARIRRGRTRQDARPTFWCPSCQPQPQANPEATR